MNVVRVRFFPVQFAMQKPNRVCQAASPELSRNVPRTRIHEGRITRTHKSETGTLILEGKPQTYKPPRFFRGHVYAPHNREKKNAQRILEEQAGIQRPGAPPIRHAVKVDVTLDFKRPKSHWSKNNPATGQLKPSASQHVTKKPDVDNCLKFVLDAPTTLLAQHAA